MHLIWEVLTVFKFAICKRQRREHYAHGFFFWDTVIFYLYILATNSKKAKEKSVMKLLFVFNWQIISDKKTSAQKIPNQLFSNLLQYYSLLSQCSVPCF